MSAPISRMASTAEEVLRQSSESRSADFRRHMQAVLQIGVNHPNLLKSEAGTALPTAAENEGLFYAFYNVIVSGYVELADYLYNNTILAIAPNDGPLLFHDALWHHKTDAMKYIYDKRHEINGDSTPTRYVGDEPARHCILEHKHEYVNCAWRDGPVLSVIACLYFEGREYYIPGPSQTHVLATDVLNTYGEVINVNAYGEYNNRAPLHEAAFRGDHQLAEVLIDHGAIVDLDEHGETPLVVAAGHAARPQDTLETVSLLLQHGANPNYTDSETGDKPLHFVAELHRGNFGRLFAQMLIQAGANINATREDNCTPLHQAAWEENTEVVRCLLVYGADVLREDAWNRTALQCAYELGHAPCIRLLRLYQRRVLDVSVSEGTDLDSEDDRHFRISVLGISHDDDDEEEEDEESTI